MTGNMAKICNIDLQFQSSKAKIFVSLADAFVARVLANQFPLGSVLSFLIIGQILDLRNVMLFKKNFSLSLFFFIAVLSIILTFLWGLGADVGMRLHSL
ncbi:permease [Desulfosporosinus sp. FKB]|uniref:permease n=1 Tax=Desulfosporosinus sp. FKB TaxID=1969835 RepID=UPI001FA901FB|nr:permease [Desulfosporosinus sp. FKB]